MQQLSQPDSHPLSGRLCLCGSILLMSMLLIPTDRAVATVSPVNDPADVRPGVAAQRVSQADVVAAQKFGEGISNSQLVDYLGPLAPVALSPFFGIACLSGLALYGGQHVSADNPFLSEGSALNNPAVFWTFVFLTVLTSLPRLTKVSKPFAQAIDQVEAWAGIVTILVLKMMSGGDGGGIEPDTVVFQAGFLSVTADSLLMIASVINIFVINVVKFFFEMLIWITPMPFLDAVFEVLNKAACAVLMSIYVWSPTAAMIINLLMFSACLLVFGWVKRREVFFRTIILDPILGYVFQGSGEPTAARLTVFPKRAFGPYRMRVKCRLEPNEQGWLLTQRRWFRPAVTIQIDRSKCQLWLEPGFLTNAILLHGEPTANLSFSQRYKNHLPKLASILNVSMTQPTAKAP